MTLRVRVCHLLIAIITLEGILQHASAASGDGDGLVPALVTASVQSIDTHSTSGLSMLEVLLKLPEGLRAQVLETLESGNSINTLLGARNGLERKDRSRLDFLLRQVAELQGVANLRSAQVIPVGTKELSASWNKDGIGWFRVQPSLQDQRLLLKAADCAPDVVAFSLNEQNPATRAHAQVRFDEGLTTVLVGQSTALRIHRNNCTSEELTIALEWSGENSAPDIKPNKDRTRHDRKLLSLSANQPMIVSFNNKAAIQFAVPTEKGWIYQVYAAGLSEDLDPELVKADPEDPARTDLADDDGGWRYGAKLSGILGTGEPLKLAVLRNSSATGDVALLVQRTPLIALEPDSSEIVGLPQREVVWRRISLSPGFWRVDTTELTPGVDTGIVVYDAASMKVLAENDDSDDGDLAASVKIDLSEPADLVIMIGSLNHGGSCRVSIHELDQTSVPFRPSSTPSREHPTSITASIRISEQKATTFTMEEKKWHFAS